MADTVNDLTTAIGLKQGPVEPDERSIAIVRLSNRSLMFKRGTASRLPAPFPMKRSR
jgi:hypothetical protein